MERKEYKTKGKTRLLALLKKERSPQTVEEICDSLTQGGNAPGKSSVYRMLSALCETGEVKRHRLPPPATGYSYQYVGDAHRCETHFHLHCLVCGTVVHLECECGREIASHLKKEHGFVTDPSRSVLYGLCAVCAGGREGTV